jgi:hypothetical protein
MREVGEMNEGGGTCETEEKIARLMREFEACTLPKQDWTHTAHLVVGFWYLRHFPYAEAVTRIRAGIQRYNEACGVRQTPTGGYHETITLFYISMIDRLLRSATPEESTVSLAARVIDECGDRRLPLTYYTKERLMSWEARTRWVEPDLRSLID